ncbi:MAG: hypothetical protein M3252_07685 [Actinomycetota bacterium]|nr:hypothetical protein [Actinomycetota bacterium]
MDALIRRPAPLVVAPLRSVLAVAANAHDLVYGLGGLIATLTDIGQNVRVACWAPGDDFDGWGGLDAAARELDADEVLTVPCADGQGAGGLEARIAALASGSDAVLVVGVGEERADEDRRRLTRPRAGRRLGGA